jgi:hypothetical protein
MCGWDLIECELARDVHLQRPVTNERHEPSQELRVWLAVERLRFDARCRGRFWLDARGVRRLPPGRTVATAASASGPPAVRSAASITTARIMAVPAASAFIKLRLTRSASLTPPRHAT